METPTPFLLLFRPDSLSPRFDPLDRDRGFVVVCFDFRLRSVFVIVLIHHKKRQGRTSARGRKSGERTFELKSHRLTRVMPKGSVSAGRLGSSVRVTPGGRPSRRVICRSGGSQAKSSTLARPDSRLTSHLVWARSMH